jgi:non-ribosomal peptide synthetase-like protein
MITIGAGACVSPEASILGFRVDGDQLIIEPVEIGANAYVGLRSVLRGHARLGKDAVLEDLASLECECQVPDQEVWAGSPAKYLKTLSSSDCSPIYQPSISTRLYTIALQSLGMGLLVLLFPVGALVPAVYLVNETQMMFGYWAYVTLLPLCAIYVVSFIGLTALCVRILGPGRRSSGSHSLHSTAFVQQWFADAVMTASLVCIKPIYGTIFTPHFLRLLGARVGNRAEVSTVKHISAFNLTVGAETFLADSVSVGSARVQRGQITIKPTVIGNGTFIGNSALLPGGTTLGAGILIGALSTTPHQIVQHESSTAVGYPADGTSWIGSPSFELPNRPVNTAFPKSLTFDPPFRLVLERAFIECFKITLPPYFSFLAVSLMFEVYKIGKEKNCMFLAKVVLCSSSFSFACWAFLWSQLH